MDQSEWWRPKHKMTDVDQKRSSESDIKEISLRDGQRKHSELLRYGKHTSMANRRILVGANRSTMIVMTVVATSTDC